MSVLLGHIKAFRALATELLEGATRLDADEGRAMLGVMGAAYRRAADRLEEQMRAESSNPPAVESPCAG